jgi:beta-glucosidase
LSNGSPVAMPWVQAVPAILEGYLGGQAGAGAIADILFGKTNPSGKLAESFPLKLEDNPSYHYFPGGPATVEYRESIYVGYRYYDTVGQEVLFPFGHGLSYTMFEYSNLQLSQDKVSDGETVTVSLNVRNTGAVAGQEIVQLYVRDVQTSVFRPAKELKGFTKVDLQPGAETTVTLYLDRRAFAYYDTGIEAWAVESGIFEILVGASSQDIRLQATAEVTSSQPAASGQAAAAPAVYRSFPKAQPVSRKDFEALLRRPLPPNEPARKGRYTVNTPIGDMTDSFIGRQLYNLLNRQMEQMMDGQGETPTAHLMRAVAREAPLRFMMMTSSGAITPELLEALLKLTNGSYVSGSGSLLKAIFSK